MNTTGLVRVTVAAPNRRIDLALPEQSPLAEVLPGLLEHAGDHLADQGVGAGGWTLRRADGSALEPARTLAGNKVRDGEVLHLALARVDWPELEYDDLVDAIATGSTRNGSAWGPRHTRWAGFVAGAVAGALCLVAVLLGGPSWTGPSSASLVAVGLLLVVGVVLARAAGDTGAGAFTACCALPFAFVGGGLLFAGDRALTGLGSPHLLTACAAVLLTAVIGLLGVADRTALFTGAASLGLLGVVGAWLSTSDALDGARAAAIVAAAALVFSPALATLAIRLAKVPVPVLPRSTADLVRDAPQPPRSAVHAAVVRADGLLTGMVAAAASATVPCQVLLVLDGTTAGVVFVAVLTAGVLLRARLYPILRQRVPLALAGLSGAVCLAVGSLLSGRLDLVAPGLLVLGAFAVLLGLRHSARPASPYTGRYAELLEVLVVLSVVPLLCWVLGLYSYLRGLAG